MTRRATLLATGLAFAAGTGFLPPAEAPPGARGALSTETVRANEARAREAGAAGGSPTLTAGADAAHALVLLVAFADTAWAAPDVHTTAYYDSLLFAVSTPSVRTYYDEISGGRFTLTGDVHAVRELPVSIVDYTGDGTCSGCCCGTAPYPANSQKLVEDLVARVDPEVDFSRYDGDGDGVVDLLFVVHAGIDVADRPVPRQFASHQWHTVETPDPDGVRVEGYALLAEWSGIGGFAHEMTHLFGVPDLWDITCCSQGLGDWSLMASGARLGSPRYTNPAHPDAWTRIRLGFLTPAEPSGAGDVTLVPVETGGEVLRLDAGAREGPEYFLVEHRDRSAGRFDGALPGEGVLVYHVDERVALNTEPPHYKVALEQADGRFDLEYPRFLDLLGDGGDPFPGDSARSAFDDDTTPSARRYDGTRSGVSLSGITIGAGSASVTVSVAPGAVLDATLAFAEESAGDGDLRPEAGETWTLDLGVRNTGRDTPSPIDVEATGGDGVSPGGVTLDALAAGGHATRPGAFTLTLPDTLAANPAVVPIRVVLATGGTSDTVDVPLVVGDRFGLETASFEKGLGGWTHGLVALGRSDPWHVSARRAAEGTYALACADEVGGDYPDSIDAVATSPPVLLGAGSRLSFVHWIDAESAPPRDAIDGGRIEVSTDGVRFTTLVPDGGYTHTPYTNAGFPLFDSDVFSGRSADRIACEGGWCPVEADLSAYDGLPLRVRFRFGSDRRVGAAGWFVDEVRIDTDGAPVAFHLFLPEIDADGVRVAFTVLENLVRFAGRVRLERDHPGGDGAPVVLFADALGGGGHVEVTDDAIAPGETRRYRLIEEGEGGTPDSVRAERLISLPALPLVPAVASAGPVPFRAGEGVFRIVLTQSRRPALDVSFYDVSGRRVARVHGRRLGDGTQVMEWDGRGPGARVLPAGVYFYRVPGVATGRTLLVR